MGTLLLFDDFRVYGCYTNTHHKIIVIGDFLGPESPTMKETFSQLNLSFSTALQNPFQPTDQPIKSTKLDQQVNQILLKHSNIICGKK